MLPINLERAQFDRYHAGALGKELANKKHVLKCTYDFAVLAGAQGALNLSDQYGNIAKVPSGAIITDVWAYVVTAPLSLGSATIALGLNTTTDCIGATGKATFSLAAIVAGTPTGSLASAFVVLTAERKVVMTIGTADLTAGKVDFYLEFAFVAA